MRRTEEMPSSPADPAPSGDGAEGPGDQDAGDGGSGRSEDVSRMGRGAGLNVIGAALSQGSLFLILMILARNTSLADVGRYSICYALLTILSLLALGGVRATLTRFVAMRLADGDPGAVRGTIRLGMSVAVVGSLVVSVSLAALSGRVADLLHEPELAPGIVLVAVSVMAVTIEGAALAATQGWRSQRAFTLIGQILDPGLRLLLTALAVWMGLGLMAALWAIVISSWTAAVLSVVVLLRRLRRVERARPRYDPRPMASFAVVSWGSTLATTGLVWADALLLGYLASAQDVGLYTVATRLVGLAIFVLNPINSAFVPHVAHLYHLEDRDGVDVAFGAANRWIIRLSAPAFILLLAYPRDLLGLFGDGYTAAAAATVTVVLAIGQLANAAAGPCGSVLNMTGLREGQPHRQHGGSRPERLPQPRPHPSLRRHRCGRRLDDDPRPRQRHEVPPGPPHPRGAGPWNRHVVNARRRAAGCCGRRQLEPRARRVSGDPAARRARRAHRVPVDPAPARAGARRQSPAHEGTGWGASTARRPGSRRARWGPFRLTAGQCGLSRMGRYAGTHAKVLGPCPVDRPSLGGAVLLRAARCALPSCGDDPPTGMKVVCQKTL